MCEGSLVAVCGLCDEEEMMEDYNCGVLREALVAAHAAAAAAAPLQHKPALAPACRRKPPQHAPHGEVFDVLPLALGAPAAAAQRVGRRI